jgi:hypothetical protein
MTGGPGWSRFFVVLVMTVALVGGLSSAQANPESEDATAVGNAIESFGNRLASPSDALGEYGDLAKNLPLGDLAPGDPRDPRQRSGRDQGGARGRQRRRCGDARIRGVARHHAVRRLFERLSTKSGML